MILTARTAFDPTMIEIEVANQQSSHAFEADRLKTAVRLVLGDEGVSGGAVSIAVMDDASIHQLNRQYLQHDYATDVLSFLLESDGQSLEGQIVVSVETAARSAPEYGWSTDDELLLYVIHGALHLIGYDDTTAEARNHMRSREHYYLDHFGIQPRDGDAGCAQTAPSDSDTQGVVPDA
jgi:probable rRNA maturation factor